MQLALENKRVTVATDGYLDALSKSIENQQDTIGFAYAINGKLTSADVYASHDLFVRMWPKLLRSSAVEAVAEKPKAAASQTSPEVSAVSAMLAGVEKATEASKQVNGRLTVVKRDSSQTVLYESQTKDVEGGWMHRSYVVK